MRMPREGEREGGSERGSQTAGKITAGEGQESRGSGPSSGPCRRRVGDTVWE